MTVRVGINGFGRIGRNFFRAVQAQGADIEIVAVNDLGSVKTMAHLLKYDSVMRQLPNDIKVSKNGISVDGVEIKVLSERDPKNLPWGELGVDVVIESTGFFTKRDAAAAHLEGGAPLVIVSAPCDGADATFVYGVNHKDFDFKTQKVISNASCTTNCLAPMVKALNDRIGVVSGLMTTIHAYTNDQVLTDVYHEDLRRARSATQSMIPTKTGAASAVGLVMPELNGKLDGYAIRVPTINVSVVDLVFVAKRATTVDEVNSAVKQAADGDLKGILEYNTAPLVSVDFNHNPASSIFDSTLTKVSEGTLVKVSAWYDNEWGFSNRMLDTTVALMNAK